MEYTKNYHLPQWVKEDRIMMDDFNQMCADVESGLTENAATASAAKAQADKGVSDAAAAQTAANSAQSTANSAVSKADAAQTTANKAVTDAAAAQKKADAAYAPDQPPYVVGTYTGTNANLSVTLGFRPKFVLISCTDGQDAYLYTMAAGSSLSSTRLEFTSTGFTVKPDYVSNSARQVPYTNTKGLQYMYIAFR